MKRIVIIYHEKRYLDRLTEQIRRWLPEDYTAAGYLSVQSYEERNDSEDVRAVLMEETKEDYGERLKKWANQDIKVWFLTENRDREQDPGMLYVYRPAREFAEKLSVLWKKPVTRIREEETGYAEDCRCVGVMTVDGESSTEFAGRQAKAYAQNGKTLFLCLNPWAKLYKGKERKDSERLSAGRQPVSGYECGVSELFYMLKEYGEDWYSFDKLCGKIENNVRTIGGYRCLSDIRCFGKTEVAALQSGLKKGGYRSFVVDFGDSPISELAEICDDLYLLGDRQSDHFAEAERLLATEGMAERIRSANEI